MKKTEQILPENRGRKNNRARSKVAKKLPEKSEKTNKKEPNKWLPIVAIFVLLAAVAALCLFLDWTNCNTGSSLSDNINDTGNS